MSVLLIAAITDLVRRKIYDWLTLPALVLGVAINTIGAGWPGLGFGLLGLVVGGLLFLPFLLVEGMGAGDIKLMAVVGAFGGAGFVLQAWFYTAVAGGLWAVAALIIKGKLIATLKNLLLWIGSMLGSKRKPAPFSEQDALPYAAFIFLGTLAALFLPPVFVI
ncbi:MAG: A24 family peptidase [candidate division FCPU426 bacterium]